MTWLMVSYLAASLGAIIVLSGKLGSAKRDLRDARNREESHERAYQKMSVLVSRYRNFTVDITRGRFNHLELRDAAAKLSDVSTTSNVSRSDK